MLLEDKIGALVEILDDILNCEICDTKILIADDLNANPGEKKAVNDGEFKEIEEMLLSYDIIFKSDTSGNIPTHYNYNGGWSQVDFLATSSNFHKITTVR